MCRDACINFKELCKKKHSDGLWMDELAAVKACPPSELSYMGAPGIILTSENGVSGQNITLNFPTVSASMTNGSLDASKSDTTASQASSDGNRGFLFIYCYSLLSESPFCPLHVVAHK